MDFLRRLRRLIRRDTFPSPDDVAEKGARRLEEARRRSAEWVEQGTETARDVARRSAERIEAVAARWEATLAHDVRLLAAG